MSFLPPKSKAALNDLENCVDAQIARLRYSSRIGTEWFRQAQWIIWCQVKKILDPCGNERGYKRIVACFGLNLVMDYHSRSATIQGYTLTINKLMSKIIHAREREENIARHQSPLTREMYVEVARHAKASSCDSIDAVLFVFSI